MAVEVGAGSVRRNRLVRPCRAVIRITRPCGAAVATSSMATEMIKGKSVSEALELTNAAVVEALEGLPPQKIHCSVLAEEAVKAAIEDYMKKKAEQAGKA